MHGLALPGVSDQDEMGIFVEPPHRVLGVGERLDRYVFRSRPEGTRSEPGDTDLVMYSLRRYLQLATKGNPTALLPLYAPAESTLTLTALGSQLRDLAPALLSQQAVHRFLGYLQAQLDRLLGQSARRGMPNRPELVQRHGYDTKYASHALRLAYQGLEVARDGRLSLPMPTPERDRVMAVKQGAVSSLDQVVSQVESVRSQVRAVLDEGRSPLPEQPDLAAVGAWSVQAHRQHWGWA